MKLTLSHLIAALAMALAGNAETDHAVSDLHHAIIRGDQATWQHLLSEGADIETQDQAGDTPLHLAALHGQVECVRALLQRGAKVNALNHANATPLLYGITNLEIVRLLLEHKADPNAMSKLGMTPLLAAVSRGQSYEIAKLLLEAGADVHVTREGPWDGGALYRAIQSGDQRTIDLMWSKSPSIEAFGKSFSPLHIAAMRGDLRTVKRLVEAGARVNYSDNGWGDAPGHALNWAMWSENHAIAAYLINHGSDLKFAPPIPIKRRPWCGRASAKPRIRRSQQCSSPKAWM